MTTSTVIPFARASRAALSMRARSESESHPFGSVTIPLVASGDAAKVGAPTAMSSVVSNAMRFNRRIRDTSTSCVVANRQRYTTPHTHVHRVMNSAPRDYCRGVSLREMGVRMGASVLFATGESALRRGAGMRPMIGGVLWTNRLFTEGGDHAYR